MTLMTSTFSAAEIRIIGVRCPGPARHQRLVAGRHRGDGIPCGGPASSGWRVEPPMPITRRRSARWGSAPTDTPGDLKRIQVSVFDGQSWSKDATAFIDVVTSLIAAPPGLDLDANNSTGGGADATATYTAGGPAIPVTDIDVSITDRRARRSVGDDHDTRMEPAPGRRALHRRHAAGRHHGIELQSDHRRSSRSAARRRSPTIRPRCARWSSAAPRRAFHGRPRHPGDGQRRQRPRQQSRDDVHARRDPAAERCAGARPRREQLDDARRKLSHRVHGGRPAESPSWIPTF